MTYVRSGLVVLLLFVGALGALAANATVWANRTVFNTDNFVATTNRVLDDDDVQQALATRLSETLIEKGDVEARLRDRLPENQQRFAPLLSATAQDLVYKIILRLLENDTVRDGLDFALRNVHQQVLRIIEDEGAVVIKDGEVVLDMQVVLQRAADELGLDPDIGSNLPDDAGQIVLIENANTAGAVQQLLSLHNTITWLVVAVSIGALAAAVALAKDRRATLRTAGIVLVVVGFLAALLLFPLRPIVAAFAQNGDAARAAFDAFFLDYRIQSLFLMLFGIVVLAAAVLIGDGELAKALRGSVRRAPGSEAPDVGAAVRSNATGLRVSGFAVGALVLVAWPQPSNRVYVTTFVLLGLYLGILWVITGSGELATRARQGISQAWSRAGGSERQGATFAGRHVGMLRLAGLAGALVACLAVPNFGIGAFAGIVALTLGYLAFVDWLAARQT